MINVSAGDEVSEISKLARNAQIDVMVVGTSTKTPLEVGEGAMNSTLGSTVNKTILKAPCPVIVVPPALVPGLVQG